MPQQHSLVVTTAVTTRAETDSKDSSWSDSSDDEHEPPPPSAMRGRSTAMTRRMSAFATWLHFRPLLFSEMWRNDARDHFDHSSQAPNTSQVLNFESLVTLFRLVCVERLQAHCFPQWFLDAVELHGAWFQGNHVGGSWATRFVGYRPARSR